MGVCAEVKDACKLSFYKLSRSLVVSDLDGSFSGSQILLVIFRKWFYFVRKRGVALSSLFIADCDMFLFVEFIQLGRPWNGGTHPNPNQL